MKEAAVEAAVAQAVEAYRKAMLAADKAQLDAMCMDRLTYGHTSGKVETKSEFIAAVTNGKTVWKSLTFEAPTNCVVGDTAISRYTFIGENQSEGKTNALTFSVVMVWQKQGGQWKLLVRQGFNRIS
jgi:ketosteroid isomerase-like protein